MTEAGVTAGMIIALIMGIIVAGTIITSVNTDAVAGSYTTYIGPLSDLAFVAFSIAGIGIVAYVGKYIISIFQ
jgi:hypothetical protein